MAIQTYIENMRTKPEHLRRRFAFYWAFGITAVIFMFWLGSITGLGIGKNSVVASAASRISSPSQSMVAGVGALGQDIWQLIFGPKKITYSTVEVSPGK